MTPSPPPDWRYGETLDFGDKGCGDLVLELGLRLRNVEGGARILVVARDPGAPIDLPAWCRTTKNHLLAAEPPYFLIERAR